MTALSRTLRSILIISTLLILSLQTCMDHGPQNLAFTSNVKADSFTDKLSDGQQESTITFGQSGGTDTSAKFAIPKRSVVSSANFKLAGLPDSQNDYPANVKVDVGDDGDLDWEFNYSVAGSLGKQDVFLGGLTSKSYRLDNGGFDNSLFIRLPRTANVVSATLDVAGEHHGVPNGNFSTNTMDKWTVVTNQYTDTVRVSNVRGGNNPPVSWGATGSYLMLRSEPFGSHDIDCNIVVESDTFPRFNTNYITMDWDLVENDNFNLRIRIYDENNNFVTAKSFGGDNNVDHTETLTKQVTDIQSLTGQNLKVVLELWDGDAWPDMTYNDWGRLAVDNVIISNATGNPLPDYPTNISVDFGNDGTKEFTALSLEGSQTVSGLVSALNSLLGNPSPSCQVTVDDYGNEYLDIPLNVSVLSSPGLVNLTNLEITYDWKATVLKNPRGTLADELNSLIPTSGTGNVTIPVSISSAGAGKIKISDIRINYNAVPVSAVIPAVKINEDSLNPKVIDLENFFSDDSPAGSLSFEVAENTAAGTLEAYVEDDRFLTLNSNIVPDWYGNATLVIRASDSKGLTAESNPFIVQVLPVNDEPRPNIQIGRGELIEDGAGFELELDKIPYFIDPEGDKLYYSADSILDDTENVSIAISDENILEVRPGKDWNGIIPIWLYCDDDKDVDTELASPHQEFSIDVISINDPPEFINLATLHLNEDEGIDNWMNIYDMVTDVESPDDKLWVTIVSNDNPDNIHVEIDALDFIDISLPVKDYVGTGRVKFKVVDEDGSFAEQSLKIQVNPVNDGPRIIYAPDKLQLVEDNIDSSMLNIYDIFYDPDSPNLYSTTGNEHLSITIFEGNGTVILKPEKNWHGSEIVTFSAMDTYLESDLTQKYVTVGINITVTPVNDPPDKPVIKSPKEPRADPGEQSVTFIAEDASDPDSSELEYYWDFDNRIDSDSDGDPANDRDGIGKMVVHKYPETGYYYATLVVSDGELNSTESAGVYVKVTTNYDKVSEGIREKAGTDPVQILYLIPFLIVTILMVFLIMVYRRKIKADEKDKKAGEQTDVKPGSPRVVEGQLVSEPKVPVTGTALTGTDKPSLPPGSEEPDSPAVVDRPISKADPGTTPEPEPAKPSADKGEEIAGKTKPVENPARQTGNPR